jgi:hypothetical protein
LTNAKKYSKLTSSSFFSLLRKLEAAHVAIFGGEAALEIASGDPKSEILSL